MQNFNNNKNGTDRKTHCKIFGEHYFLGPLGLRKERIGKIDILFGDKLKNLIFCFKNA